MKRGIIRSLSVLSLVPITLFMLAVILTTTPVFASTTYTYNFSSTLAPWADKGDSGIGRAFTLETGDDSNNFACPSLAAGYAQLANTTSVPDGQGLWMYASFPVSGPGTVEMKWDAYDPLGACGGNCKAAAYVGATAPTVGSALSTVGTISGSAWTGYSYGTFYTPPGPTGNVYVAIGWLNAAGTTIGTAKVRHDCVRVTVP